MKKTPVTYSPYRPWGKALASILRKDALDQVIKATDEKGFEAMMAALAEALQETKDYVFQSIIEKAIEVLRRTEDVEEAVKYLAGWSQEIAATATVQAAQEVKRLTENLYKAGFFRAQPGLSLSLKDLDAMDVLGKQNLFWIGEHYNLEVKERFDRLIKEYFDEGIGRQELAQRLRDALGPWAKEEDRYWEGLADHISSKVRELGRIAGYERAGVEYVKVKAILDAKTSRMCRDMHGRIISVKRLQAQRDEIMAAGSRAELLAASRWIESFSGKTSELPGGVGMPPYHYRCRTVTVAWFEGVDDTGREYQYFDGDKRRKEKILFQYVDKELGREFIVTEGSMEHIISEHPAITRHKLEAALRSITHYGGSIENDGELVTLSQNGIALIFRNNVVYTAFKPDYPKDYFRRCTTGGIRKWLKRLQSYYTGLFTR